MLHQTDAGNFSCQDIRKEMDFAKTYSLEKQEILAHC